MDHFEPGSLTLDKACKAKKDASRTQCGKQSKERAEHASFTVFIIFGILQTHHTSLFMHDGRVQLTRC
jgi:hypothetical protein